MFYYVAVILIQFSSKYLMLNEFFFCFSDLFTQASVLFQKEVLSVIQDGQIAPLSLELGETLGNVGLP